MYTLKVGYPTPLVLLLEWLTLWPNVVPFPQTEQTLAISISSWYALWSTSFYYIMWLRFLLWFKRDFVAC